MLGVNTGQGSGASPIPLHVLLLVVARGLKLNLGQVELLLVVV